MLEFESICGPTEDFQDVERYDGTLGPTVEFVAAHERPVGQLVWRADIASRWPDPGNVAGERFCTGTLVARDIFLSAAHCFEGEGSGWAYPRDANGHVITPEQVATEYEVHFNYQVDPEGNLRPESVYLVEQMVEFRAGGFDYALIRVQGNPGDTWGFTRVEPVTLTVGDDLTIIQHPATRPKQIEAGHFSGYDEAGSIMYNDLDTLGGSSGSGILGANGTVIGVHPWGGCTETGGENKGIGVAQIVGASSAMRVLALPSCATDADCEDGCITGVCEADNRCSVQRRCEPSNDLCTANACDPVELTCNVVPVTCDDHNECTADLCDSVTGCGAVPVAACTACGASGSCLDGVCVASGGLGGDFESGLSDGWIQSGVAPWAIDTATAHGGAAAVGSGDVDDNQESTITIGVNLSTTGVVSFWHRENSEADFDYLIFEVDGQVQMQWSGESDWAEASFALDAGPHLLGFRYIKDGSVSTPADRVWIDDLTVSNQAPACCQPSDATCDGIDDDCDGAIDDDVAVQPTTCGADACAATGELRCMGGAMVDTCVPASSAADTSCDGIDQDCNGVADDGFVVQPTTCGVGACAATGELRCQDGATVDTCSAGTGTADTTCDGVDDDCDGTADDEVASTPITCGSEECPSTGERVCVDGALVDECVPKVCEPEGGCGGCATGGGSPTGPVLVLIAGFAALLPRRRRQR